MRLNKAIEGIGWIKDIIKYIVPVSDTPKDKVRHSKLEEEVIRSKETVKHLENIELFEQVLAQLMENKDSDFSFSFKKDKEEIREATSFVINYQENEREERLDVEGEDEDGKKYSFSIIKNKLVPEVKPYQLNIFYKNNRDEERLDINYSIRDYPAEREEALQDFTNRADKSLHIMPKSIMGGILGFTYLGENFMARRDDLVGDTARMVDVHEAIHTPDEYETRVLTDWMLTREMPKYKR